MAKKQECSRFAGLTEFQSSRIEGLAVNRGMELQLQWCKQKWMTDVHGLNLMSGFMQGCEVREHPGYNWLSAKVNSRSSCREAR